MNSAVPVLHSLETLKTLFPQRLRDTLMSFSRSSLAYTCVSFQLDGFDLTAFSARQSFARQFYFSERDRDELVLCLGISRGFDGDTLADVYGDIQQSIAHAQGHVRFYGGVSFSSVMGHYTQSWPSVCFFVPLFEFRRLSDQSIGFTCHLWSDDSALSFESIMAQFDAIRWDASPLSSPVRSLHPHQLSVLPSECQWTENVSTALNHIHEGELEKVVLARVANYGFDSPVNGLTLLSFLDAYRSRCFLFFLRFDPLHSFFGATPEQLFYRRDRRVFTEALAGTVQRGSTQMEDDGFKHVLSRSEKNIQEHDHVQKMILSRLSALCADVEKSVQLDAIQLPNVHHLYRSFEGILHPHVTDFQLISALFPTPAVAGVPTASALKLIRQLEGFDRGWYAGLIGYFGQDETVMSVAIRSAFQADNQLSVYAGAGIVDGSDAEEEWQELNFKSKPLTDLFS